jgi:hypothetical protein
VDVSGHVAGDLSNWALGDLGDLGDNPDDLDGGLFRGLDPALLCRDVDLGRFTVRAASGLASSSKISSSSRSSRVAANLNAEFASCCLGVSIFLAYFARTSRLETEVEATAIF